MVLKKLYKYAKYALGASAIYLVAGSAMGQLRGAEDSLDVLGATGVAYADYQTGSPPSGGGDGSSCDSGGSCDGGGF